MEVPVWRTDKKYAGFDKTFTRLNQLLDLTPLEPDEWHAIVAYHRVMNNCMSGDDGSLYSYPDNGLSFDDSQPRELYYLWPYLGQDFRKFFQKKYYTSKC